MLSIGPGGSRCRPRTKFSHCLNQDELKQFITRVGVSDSWNSAWSCLNSSSSNSFWRFSRSSSSRQWLHSYNLVHAGPPPKVECRRSQAFWGKATQRSKTFFDLVGSTPPWRHRKSELSMGPESNWKLLHVIGKPAIHQSTNLARRNSQACSTTGD